MKNYLYQNDRFLKSPEFFDELPLWSAPFGLKLLEFIDYKPNTTALDIGFGSGFPFLELAMRLGENSFVYGIDPSPEAIDRTQKKMKHFEIKNVQIIKGMAENIPLQNSSINLITSNNGLNNVDDFERAISECSRIAKPGAQFIQTLNLDDSLFEFYGQFKEILSYMRMYQEIELMQQHIYQKRKPLDELIPVMQKRGFVIRDLEYDQFNFRFADGSAFLNHAFIRMAFVDSWLAILPEGKQEIIFDAIESRLNNIANSLGGLKLSIPFALINATKD